MIRTSTHAVIWHYDHDTVPYFQPLSKRGPLKLSQRIPGARTETRTRDLTVCIVIDSTNDKEVGKATIVRGWNDKQNYDLARKESLKRALDNSNLTKEQRSAIWEEYRTSTKVPKWKNKRTVASAQ